MFIFNKNNFFLLRTLFILFTFNNISFAQLHNKSIQEKAKNKPTWMQLLGFFKQAEIVRGSKNDHLIIALDTTGRLVKLGNNWQVWKSINSPIDGNIIDISVGGDGTIGCIDKQEQVWLQINNEWLQLPDKGFKQISVGNQYEIWATKKDNTVWRKTNKTITNKNYQWIGYGIGTYVSCSGDGTVLVVGYDQLIYELQRDDFKWKIRANPTDALSGSPRIISMSDSLTIATLDILNVVWFLIPGTQGNLQGDWQKVSISKKPVHISIGIDKTLLIVDEENKINVRIPSVEERQDLTKMRGINVHAGQIVRISSGSNMRHRRLWTHAGSAYDPFGTNNPPNNPLEVLVGSDSKEDNREDVGCFFDRFPCAIP